MGCLGFSSSEVEWFDLREISNAIKGYLMSNGINADAELEKKGRIEINEKRAIELSKKWDRWISR
jgi:hypothetical protein